MLGRLANFVNGELWGRVTTVPWAVIFPHSPAQYNAMLDYYGPDPRHPSQLYQAGLEGAILFAYLQVRFWRGSLLPGQIAGEFLIGYALLRMFGELFREPDAALILNLSRGQFYSVFLLIAGMLTLFFDPQKWHASDTETFIKLCHWRSNLIFNPKYANGFLSIRVIIVSSYTSTFLMHRIRNVLTNKVLK